MSNLYDQAYDFEKAVSESEEFQGLKLAYETVMADADAKVLFEEFRDTQVTLQEKQMNGEEITEEEIQKANEVVEKVQGEPLISKLMEEEHRLNTIITEVSGIITKPLEELYSTE